MQLHFTGRNIEVTPALKTFTQEKMERVERRYNTINKVNVVFHVEHLDHIAEANVNVDGTELHATAKAENMYSAIDMLVDKLLGQITKHKEKSADRR
jgi:putative sigma-54 modulation protein